MTETQEVQVQLKKKDVKLTRTGRFKCPICIRSYKTFAGVRRHYNHQHLNLVPEPIGRPTKYTPELIPKMIKFFGAELVQVVDREYVDKKGEKKTLVEIVPRELPTFEMFAHKNDLTVTRLKEWQKEENVEKYPGFRAAYEHCKALQKDFLVQNTLLGRYNQHFAKFVAINITDMRDKKVTEVGGIPGQPIELMAIPDERRRKVLEAFDEAVEKTYEQKRLNAGSEDSDTK